MLLFLEQVVNECLLILKLCSSFSIFVLFEDLSFKLYYVIHHLSLLEAAFFVDREWGHCDIWAQLGVARQVRFKLTLLVSMKTLRFESIVINTRHIECAHSMTKASISLTDSRLTILISILSQSDEALVSIHPITHH